MSEARRSDQNVQFVAEKWVREHAEKAPAKIREWARHPSQDSAAVEFLERIAEGLDNAEIAGSLCLSEKTVRNHITRVFDKICVEHRYQAIVLAREAGLGRASRLVNKR